MSCPVVITGAMLRCSMGSAPGSFTGGCTRVFVTGKPAGTVMDTAMGAHIAPFALCTSLANPAVAAATAAAFGVLTPMPCTPSATGPWSPGAAHVTLEGQPALLQTDTATCAFGGTVSVSDPGQQKVYAV